MYALPPVAVHMAVYAASIGGPVGQPGSILWANSTTPCAVAVFAALVEAASSTESYDSPSSDVSLT